MSAAAKSRPTLTVAFDGARVAGMILSRGKSGFEAWTADEKPLGLYETAALAHDAIIKATAAA